MVESALPLAFFITGTAAGIGVCAYVLKAKTSLLAQAVAERNDSLALLQSELNTARESKATLEERVRAAEELRVDLAAKEVKVDALIEEITLLREERSHIQTKLEEEKRAFGEQRKTLDDAQLKLADSFNALSSDALRKNNQAFLELAQETLAKFNEQANGDLEKKQQAIDNLVNPLKESLLKVDEHIKELEGKRTSAYATLTEQVKALGESQNKLQGETSNLVKALRNPNQRGRWGEMQLRRVVEMADMLSWCDFSEQQTTTNDGNVLRPDLTVKLPNNKVIVVDSKTPLDAYLRAVEATDDAEKADAYKNHARQVREHVKKLSSKRYWDQFESTPEFVIMFIPSEPMFGAAVDNDPMLIEDASNQKVLIATPTTLIALLKSVAYGWRQEQLAENALKISQLGRDLYARMAQLAEHFSKVGKSLDRAVVHYNETVGSFENRVLPQARKFKELQASTSEDIEILEPLERTTRVIQGRELKTRTHLQSDTIDLFAEVAN